MNLLNDDSRLGRVKVRHGLKISRHHGVCGYIMQIRLERAVKKYIQKWGGDMQTLEIDACSYIKNMPNEILDKVTRNIEEGKEIIEALFDHEGKKDKKLKAKLLEL